MNHPASPTADCLLVHPVTLEAHRVRLLLSRRGLTVLRVGPRTPRTPGTPRSPRGRRAGSEIRVPWWSLEGFDADGMANGPDGTALQSLEIGTTAGTLFVAAPAAEVSRLFAQLDRYRARWQRWRSPSLELLGHGRAAAGLGAARVGRRLGSALGPIARPAGRLAVPPLLVSIDAARLAVALVLAVAAGGAAAVRFAGRGARRVLGPPTRTALGLAAALDVLARMAAGPLLGPGSRAARAAAGPLGLAARHGWRVVRAGAGRAAVPLAALGRSVAASPPGRVLAAAGSRTRQVAAPPLRHVALRLRPAARLARWPLASTGRRQVTGISAALASVLLALAVGGAGLLSGPQNASGVGHSVHVSLTHRGDGNSDTLGMSRLLGAELSARGAHQTPPLPAATAPPAPAPPSLADAPPLQPHEVFAFAPYWTLPQSGGFDVGGMTTLAYFSIAVNADGSLDQGGDGWNGYESQALADLVTRAHAAGDRVVLTVNCFDQGTLNQLTSSPTAPATLSQALISAIAAKNLDGVNIDFEGEGSGDQSGLTNLISKVSNALHGVNPHWQVTMDTYASSAGDPDGFYNIAALAPWVDGFFVMAYQLNYASTPVASSDLTSSMFSDVTTAQQYAADVAPGKVILGLPYYGLDWPTTDGTLNAKATGPSTPVAYSQIVSSGHPIYWDATTDTGWTSYQVGSQWHETFFEVPASLYMDAQLAQNYGLDGVGIWALGMDGNDPSMLAAVDGLGSVDKPGSAGPTSTSQSPTTNPGGTTTTTNPGGTSTTTTTTTIGGSGSGGSGSGSGTTTTTTTAPAYVQSGQYLSQTVQLTRLVASDEPTGTGTSIGQLTDFTSTDPSLLCLAFEPSLQVEQFSDLPGEYVVVAAEPNDCTDAELTFPVPSTPVGNGGSGSPGSSAGSESSGAGSATGASATSATADPSATSATSGTADTSDTTTTTTTTTTTEPASRAPSG